ncbi:MAG TPA: sigma-54 dependent transcriptional regulator [Candidatus Deferrimicrobium sp.]|nr:sigma-54 dependent transcriptional regulator [Candidatus Deferrimicrobium sp.]
MKTWKETAGECHAMRGDCFCLIDEGVDRCLRKYAQLLLDHLQSLLDECERNYVRNSGAEGYFDRRAFRQEYQTELSTVLTAVVNGDKPALARALSAQGRRYREIGVPFAEIIASMPLFLESCLALLQSHGYDEASQLDAHIALARLNYVRINGLMESYHGAELEWNRQRLSQAEERLTEVEINLSGRNHLCGMVGHSAAMQKVYTQIEICSRTRETVFLVGESGTGKELAARAIHLCSGDPPERWIAVNCASLRPETMVAMLAGHRRGAFTGAVESRIGLVRSAHGGTLFLDEITEMTPEAQAVLLRVIQERAVLPLGETNEIPVSVRIIASTNSPPEQSLRDGKLRRDLFYRLKRLVIEIPPLRDHREDIPVLVKHILRKWQSSDGAGPQRTVTPQALTAIAQHHWPGNVRELENMIVSACSFSSKAAIEPDDLTSWLQGNHDQATAAHELRLSLREAERAAILRAIEACQGNKSHAARLLGISRKQLYVKLQQYHLDS